MIVESEILGKLLLELEKQLMDPEIRKNRELVSSLLSDDFLEFGSSGRVWDKGTILDLLETEPLFLQPDIVDWTVIMIAPTAALVTYRSVRDSTSFLRSSVWVQNGNDWQILFHQGTAVPRA